MKHTQVKQIVAAALVLSCAVATSAQNIYIGEKASANGISVTSWGGGAVKETSDMFLLGGYSIRVGTLGPLQGVRLAYKTPIDLSGLAANPNAVLSIHIKLPSAAKAGTTGTSSRRTMGAAAMMGGMMLPGMGGGGGMTMPGMGGMMPGMGGATGAAGTTAKPKVMQRLRVVMINDKDGSSDFVVNLRDAYSEDGWLVLGVPMKNMAGFDKSPQLKELRIAGDTQDTFYLGSVTGATDDNPLRADTIRINEDLQVLLDDEQADMQSLVARKNVWLTANIAASMIPVKVTWDIDNRDGLQTDAEGIYAQLKFPEPGKYTVTLTLTDVAGVKKPFVLTRVIEVN
ncbi:MAG: PKD domain-containing protein [Armatimonadota bacterium]